MLKSKLAPGTRCALEQGGAAPVIVAEDVDLDAMLPLLAKGGFYHPGKFVFLCKESLHTIPCRRNRQRLAKMANALIVGDPADPKTEVGPIIRHKETDRVAEWVDEAVAAGAQLICGGTKISDAFTNQQ
ncbi:MAG: hypothetical protein CM1200mP40_10180 [Gammaproteobacteria bacterium]|nr:MAG: hypothetical protein CM1200mP40_10180 [Gammaproteobacteria bacterium]